MNNDITSRITLDDCSRAAQFAARDQRISDLEFECNELRKQIYHLQKRIEGYEMKTNQFFGR